MPQKGKLEAEDKLKVVEKYLSGQLGCKEASRIAGVDTVTIRRWVNRYKAEGPTGLLSSAQNRSYSRETKLAAVQDYLSGTSGLFVRSIKLRTPGSSATG